MLPQVALQVSNDLQGAPVTPTRMRATVAAGDGLIGDLQAAGAPALSTITATCDVGLGTDEYGRFGICVASVLLPATWFSALTTDRSVTVSAGFDDGRSAMRFLSPVTVKQQLGYTLVRDVAVEVRSTSC